jgi:hypothetical protein
MFGETQPLFLRGGAAAGKHRRQDGLLPAPIRRFSGVRAGRYWLAINDLGAGTDGTER